MKKVAIYARVSTDSQTVENQLQELHAVAQRNGWIVTAVFTDEGISGAKGREKRPGFDAPRSSSWPVDANDLDPRCR